MQWQGRTNVTLQPERKMALAGDEERRWREGKKLRLREGDGGRKKGCEKRTGLEC